jgi:hypothetical protein
VLKPINSEQPAELSSQPGWSTGSKSGERLSISDADRWGLTSMASPRYLKAKGYSKPKHWGGEILGKGGGHKQSLVKWFEFRLRLSRLKKTRFPSRPLSPSCLAEPMPASVTVTGNRFRHRLPDYSKAQRLPHWLALRRHSWRSGDNRGES